MKRIAAKFEDLKKKQKKALITYITAGDPDLATTAELVLTLEKAGADIVELGIPYSDPLADGPVIQRAAQRSLQAGTTLRKVFELVEKLRKRTQIPLVFLIYYNQVLQFGLNEFVARCDQVGIDGVIIPDLPLEERTELLEIIKGGNYLVDLIPLVAPTSDQRVASIVNNATGFVYCVSSTGVTGQRDSFSAELQDFVAKVKEATDIPAAIGFGISSVASVKQLKDYADGLIIGSAIIKEMEETLNDNNQSQLQKQVHQFVSSLKQALDS